MMLRLRLSIPTARALSTSAAPAASVPRVTRTAAAAKATITPATQSASLASGVLLGTQRNWKAETVATLKAELKRRGLSQQGNKSTLVDRLQAAEASSSLVPPTPKVAPSSPSTRRSVSSSAPAQAAPTAPVAAAPTAPARLPATDEVVSTAAGDAHVATPVLAKPIAVTPASRASVPGLPLTRGSVAQAFFDIKFPDPTPIPPIPQIIPTMPDNFTVSKKSAPSLQVEPRVVTVASAATHPAGGPVSPDLPVADSYALEWDDPSALKMDKATSAALAPLEDAVHAASEAVSNLVDINLPPAPSEKDTKYVADTTPLNDEERRGAWVLAAGLAGVLLLGGAINKAVPPKSDKEKSEDKAKKDEGEKKKADEKK